MNAIGWAASPGLTPYEPAIAAMEAHAEAIRAGAAGELVWLLEHPALYSAGVSARDDDLLTARFAVHRSGRGGQFTYHGPGQRVAYVILDLRARGRDVRGFVCDLENWLIRALARLNVEAARRDGRIGVWVVRKGPGWAREDKIAAIGVRVRRWVTTHGIALNVEPDLTHYDGIVACGIREHGVTSLIDLGVTASMADVDWALKSAFEEKFGAVAKAEPPPLPAGVT
jgi:lipoyl(octanoyl) transferase